MKRLTFSKISNKALDNLRNFIFKRFSLQLYDCFKVGDEKSKL